MTTPRTRKANAPAMDNAPEPQDHKSPAQREAEGAEFISIEHAGRTFEVIADQDDWPLLAIQAFSKNLGIDAIEHLLGPRQWGMYLATNPTRRDFNVFSDKLAEEFGFGTTGN